MADDGDSGAGKTAAPATELPVDSGQSYASDWDFSSGADTSAGQEMASDWDFSSGGNGDMGGFGDDSFATGWDFSGGGYSDGSAFDSSPSYDIQPVSYDMGTPTPAPGGTMNTTSTPGENWMQKLGLYKNIKNKDGSSSTNIMGMGADQLLKLGMGAGLNYLGKNDNAKVNATQNSKNLADYLAQVTWTPERSTNYVNAVRSNTAGTVGAAASKAKGTLAEQLASAGRGGGSYGKKSQAIDMAALNSMAGATNSAIQTVNTPTSVSAAPFMAQQGNTALGDTLTGFGGYLGNQYNNQNTLNLLRSLFASA
jgi:hypothetical protein